MSASESYGTGVGGRVCRRAGAGLLTIGGFGLVPGGAQLLVLGGSPYYLLAGIALVIAGVLRWRGSRHAFVIYSITVAATIAWALFEVGSVFWSLAPRVLPLVVLGLVFILPPAPRGGTRARRILLGGLAVALAVAVIALLVTVAPPRAYPNNSAVKLLQPGVQTDWPYYANSSSATRYVDIKQINPQNVASLKVAWVYRSGDVLPPGQSTQVAFAFEVTPIKWGNSLYICTGHNIVIALDSQTGTEQWRFDPKVDPRSANNAFFCRGVTYAAPAEAAGSECPRRIYTGTADGRLIAVNADNGRLCSDFGTGGQVSLLEHMSDSPEPNNYMSSPPTIVGRNVVVGTHVTDSMIKNVSSGVIRSYDSVTGQLRWAWDMGAPDRVGSPEGGATYTPATANAWPPISADERLGLVYVPLGNASPDYFGGNRRPYDEKYVDSVVALDAMTGRPRWSFQTTHHDIWDYDLPSQPVLVDLPRPALIQATKVGQIFVLDRRDGKPIVPVTERPAPRGGVSGERLSATQPWSAISLTPPPLSEADMWGITPYDQLWCRIRFRQLKYNGIFTPQSLQGTLQYPGLMGITEWGGVAVDERRQLLVVNTSNVPYWLMLLERSKADQIPGMSQRPALSARIAPGETPRQGKEQFWFPMDGSPYMIALNPFLGPLAAPCTQPPWGHMVAIDLKSGQQIWRRPIGTSRDSGPLFHPSGLPLPMGVPNIGGPLITAGGLIFHAGTLDDYLRAYDESSGRELWRSRLPAGGQASPMSYVGADGRQYIVIAAGGHTLLRTTTGDSLVAYALN